MKKEITSQIPSSYDSEYFADGDVRRINRSDIRNMICDQCSWKLDSKSREVNCEVCGRGFRFLTHQVEEYGDHIEVNTLSGKLKIKI